MNEGILDERRRIVMLWSPRAACTVSCKMMFEHMGVLEQALRYSNWIHDYRIKKFYSLYGRPTTGKLRSYFVFKVVVNPYQRAVSCYHHYCRHRLERRRSNISFYQYLTLLKYRQIRESNAVYHARQQYCQGEERFVNFYFKAEKGQTELDRMINRRFGTKLKIADKGSQHHVQKKPYRKSLGYTPFNKIKVLPESYRCFYDEKIKRLVREVFPDDVKRYGYRYSDLK